MSARFAKDIAEAAMAWTWELPTHGTVSNETLRTATLVDIARSLRCIRAAIDSLGVDGIHGLIRLAAKEHRRREQVAAAHRKADRKRRAAKKVG